MGKASAVICFECHDLSSKLQCGDAYANEIGQFQIKSQSGAVDREEKGH